VRRHFLKYFGSHYHSQARIRKTTYREHSPEPLSDLEKAQAIKRLIEIKGWNSMRAALTLGMDRKYLMTLLSLVDAPKEVKDFIEEKLLSSIAEEIGINSI